MAGRWLYVRPSPNEQSGCYRAKAVACACAGERVDDLRGSNERLCAAPPPAPRHSPCTPRPHAPAPHRADDIRQKKQ
ncbi:unnamed protein product [Danaus chrysippus]|uniref:(African queen) hypothetical protein n=1 Tax=Danaus chrysippus TaxID=151541 RepID=A0A8J2R9M5_9NEOP|nr:unnamed protein product [Danaus chrysippus]